MPTVYRAIKITMDSEADIEAQLDNSLADGIHCIPINGILQIVTIEESDTVNSEYLDRITSRAKDTSIAGCITKKQLRELRKREQSFNSN